MIPYEGVRCVLFGRKDFYEKKTCNKQGEFLPLLYRDWQCVRGVQEGVSMQCELEGRCCIEEGIRAFEESGCAM